GKTVTGEEGDLAKDFTFTVTFSDNGTYDYTGSKNGKIKSGEALTLAHGQTITIVGIPEGTNYQVIEAEANQDGYITLSSNSSGSIIDGTVTAAFTNSKTTATPTVTPTDKPTSTPQGGSVTAIKTDDPFSSMLWLALLAFSGLGLTFALVLRRHRSKR
ncbi:MAG: DUF5979 domain-containing protein, partial [Anaerovoracaceae bacterium]